MTTEQAIVTTEHGPIARVAAEKPISISTEQQASLFWENVSFCVPTKAAAPKPTGPVTDLPSANRLVENVPEVLQSVERAADPERASSPPETLNGRPMRTVVWNLTGSVKPGEFVGLLGPSGGGKTVLLNIMSGRLDVPVGSLYQKNVYINNKMPLTRELFGKLCTYVMQDDVLMETMTPYECLSFSASLRLSCSPEEKEKHVIETIELLKLQGCMNTLVLIGGRSVGRQRAAQGNLWRGAQTHLDRRRDRYQPFHHPSRRYRFPM